MLRNEIRSSSIKWASLNERPRNLERNCGHSPLQLMGILRNRHAPNLPCIYRRAAIEFAARSQLAHQEINCSIVADRQVERAPVAAIRHTFLPETRRDGYLVGDLLPFLQHIVVAVEGCSGLLGALELFTNEVDFAKFRVIVRDTWRRIFATFVWMCMVIVGCLVLFLVLVLVVCNVFSLLGLSAEIILYAAMGVGVVFSVVFANVIIICNIALVICVLEDVSGPEALIQSGALIRGQTQVGLLIFLGSTIGMAIVEGLFEHRVKTLSYGDGSSRIWEGPLLVVMYSFVLLIDSMMNAVFYFSCRSFRMETSLHSEPDSGLEITTISQESVCIQ